MVTIHGKMAYTLEQAIDMINTLHAEVNQLKTRAATADAEHQQMHAELMKHQGQLTHANIGGKQEFRLVDPKSMAPEKLGSSKHPLPQGWR